MDVGIVLWTSFLAACLASLLFFAAVDPLLLRDAGPAAFRHIDREEGYALGFVFFWVIGSSASALTLLLLRMPPPGAERPKSGTP
ncbi:MAG: hypothetical protein JSR36_03055 [Proteobacteria bacterium]|nr:hypothetical protein [Pseudomonadota bacterium]